MTDAAVDEQLPEHMRAPALLASWTTRALAAERERDALNEAVSKALAAQLAAENEVERLHEAAERYYDWHEIDLGAFAEKWGEIQGTDKYAGVVHPLRDAFYPRPRDITEGARASFEAATSRSEESERPPVPGVK